MINGLIRQFNTWSNEVGNNMESGVDLKSNRQRVTLKDIGAQAGVSAVTVSHVLLKSKSQTVRVSESTAEAIRKIAAKMNYRPNTVARQLAGKKSKMIGIIMDADSPDIHQVMLSQMEAFAARQGFRFIIGQAHNDSDRLAEYIEDFESRGVEGLIVLSHSYQSDSKVLAQRLSGFRNTVFIHEPKEGYDSNHCVQIDYRAGMKKAVSYLKAVKRERIALFLYESTHSSIVQRELGYRDAFHDLGLLVDEDLICRFTHEDVANNKLKDLVRYSVNVQHIDSIIACDDKIAARVIKLLQGLGLSVPKDVGVIGHDNLEWGELLSPSLTTIDPRPSELARVAMNIMMNLLKGEEGNKHMKISIEPELVVRDSV